MPTQGRKNILQQVVCVTIQQVEEGRDPCEYNPNQSVGKDTLSKWMNFSAKICNFTDWDRIGNKNGRQQCISKMNRHTETIGNKSKCKHSGHTTVSGQDDYNRADKISNARIQ